MKKKENGVTLENKVQNLVYGIFAESGLQERIQSGLQDLIKNEVQIAVDNVQATVARALGINGYTHAKAQTQKPKKPRPSRAKPDKGPSKKDRIRQFLEEHKGKLFSADEIADKVLDGDKKHIVQIVNTVPSLKRQVVPNPTGGPARRIYGL